MLHFAKVKTLFIIITPRCFRKLFLSYLFTQICFVRYWADETDQIIPVQNPNLLIGSRYDPLLFPFIQYSCDRYTVQSQGNTQLFLCIRYTCPCHSPVRIRVRRLVKQKTRNFLVPVIQCDSSELLHKMIACPGQKLEHYLHQFSGFFHFISRNQYGHCHFLPKPKKFRLSVFKENAEDRQSTSERAGPCGNPSFFPGMHCSLFFLIFDIHHKQFRDLHCICSGRGKQIRCICHASGYFHIQRTCSPHCAKYGRRKTRTRQNFPSLWHDNSICLIPGFLCLGTDFPADNDQHLFIRSECNFCRNSVSAGMQFGLPCRFLFILPERIFKWLRKDTVYDGKLLLRRFADPRPSSGHADL